MKVRVPEAQTTIAVVKQEDDRYRHKGDEVEGKGTFRLTGIEIRPRGGESRKGKDEATFELMVHAIRMNGPFLRGGVG